MSLTKKKWKQITMQESTQKEMQEYWIEEIFK